MESLQLAIMTEMRAGYRPTIRGHLWGVAQFSDLTAAAAAIEAAFHLAKAVQFPETRISRWADALEQLDGCYDQSGHGGHEPAEFLPGDEGGHQLEQELHVGPDLI